MTIYTVLIFCLLLYQKAGKQICVMFNDNLFGSLILFVFFKYNSWLKHVCLIYKTLIKLIFATWAESVFHIFSIITVNYGMNNNSYYNFYVLPINPKKKLEHEIGNNICTPRYWVNHHVNVIIILIIFLFNLILR